jgi:uncharacterized BrkB/YihY/UPF0761 family membrane protein
VPRTLWIKFERDWGWNLARLLAYACLAALFAVLGLQLAILSLVLKVTSDTTEQHFVTQLLRFLPSGITTNAVLTFTKSVESAPWPVVVLGLIVALWYGTRFFVVLESCLCVIFRRPKRTWRMQNRAALTMLLLFALLSPIILLSATAAPHVPLAFVEHHTTTSALRAPSPARVANNPIFGTLAVLGGLLANFAILLVAYTRLTPEGVPIRDAAPGAALAAVLAQGYVLLFPFYVDDVLHPSQFGTVAGFVLVALVFFFAYAVFIVLGAELASLRAGYQPAFAEVTVLLAKLHVPAAVLHEQLPKGWTRSDVPAAGARPVSRGADTRPLVPMPDLQPPAVPGWADGSLPLAGPAEAL